MKMIMMIMMICILNSFKHSILNHIIFLYDRAVVSQEFSNKSLSLLCQTIFLIFIEDVFAAFKIIVTYHSLWLACILNNTLFDFNPVIIFNIHICKIDLQWNFIYQHEDIHIYQSMIYLDRVVWLFIRQFLISGDMTWSFDPI